MYGFTAKAIYGQRRSWSSGRCSLSPSWIVMGSFSFFLDLEMRSKMRNLFNITEPECGKDINRIRACLIYPCAGWLCSLGLSREVVPFITSPHWKVGSLDGRALHFLLWSNVCICWGNLPSWFKQNFNTPINEHSQIPALWKKKEQNIPPHSFSCLKNV